MMFYIGHEGNQPISSYLKKDVTHEVEMTFWKFMIYFALDVHIFK